MGEINRGAANSGGLYPVKALQFGTGNFLRAHIDWMVDIMNEKVSFDSGIQMVKLVPEGDVTAFNRQDGLYHVITRGISQGKQVDEVRLITCVNGSTNPYTDFDEYLELGKLPDLKLVFSNSTESGIEFLEEDIQPKGSPALTFPGKLTQLLKVRYDHFNGDPDKGLCFVPCELINSNGITLKNAIFDYADLWDYPDGFSDWIDQHNHFANTLVDRIVTGYPADDAKKIQENIGHEDRYLTSCEPFHLLVIEGHEDIRKNFPADKAGLNVVFTDDITPYRTTKVRILNGAHTSMVAVGLLLGKDSVREAIEDDKIGPYIEQEILEEICSVIPTENGEVRAFASEVIDRFRNPFIHHELRAISLNSISKFKVRVLPSILDYLRQRGMAPKRLSFAFACLIKLYSDTPEDITLNDDQAFIGFFRALKGKTSTEIVSSVLKNKDLWGQDLSGERLLQIMLESYLVILGRPNGVLDILKFLG